MLLFKQNVADWIAIRIEDAAGAGVTGLAYNAATFKLGKAGGAGAAKSLAASGEWVEIGNGFYWAKLAAADLDTLGPGVFVVSYLGAEAGYPFVVRAKLESDVDTSVAAVKTDTAAIKAKTDNLPANPASQTNLDVAVSTRLAATSYVAPDNTALAAALDDVAALVARALGLLDENTVRDQVVMNGNDVASARIRCYDSAANAAAAGATGLVAEYAAAYEYAAAGVLSKATVTRVGA